MAFQETYDAGNGWTWGVSDFSSAQTDAELVVAPGAGKSIQLVAWKFSSDTAQELTLEQDDATDRLIDKQYVAANGGQIARLGYAEPTGLLAAAVKLAANSALLFTSSAAGNVTVGAFYRIVSR